MDNHGSDENRHGLLPIYTQLQLSRTHPNLHPTIITIATLRSDDRNAVHFRPENADKVCLRSPPSLAGWLAGQVTGQGDATTRRDEIEASYQLISSLEGVPDDPASCLSAAL